MTSGSAQLTVNSKPRITTHPTSLSVAENTDAAFFVKATSTDSLKYQWLKNDAELPGECSDILHLKKVKCFQAGKYKVIVTNSAGTDCCDAELSVFTPKHK